MIEFIISFYVTFKGLLDDLKPKPQPDYEEIEKELGIKKEDLVDSD